MDPLRLIFAESTRDVKAMGAIRLIFTKLTAISQPMMPLVLLLFRATRSKLAP